MNNHEYIYSVNLFDDKNYEVYNKLKNISHTKSIRKKEYLYMTRDNVDSVYIILKGILVLYGVDKMYNEKIFFLLNAGTIVNDDVLYNEEVSTNCYAFKDSVVMCIDKHQLHELMSQDQDVMEYIFRSISNKLTKTYRQLKNSNTTVNIEKRLCSKLWKLAKDYGITTSDGVIIDINISTIFLSKMLGTTRESVSRNLKKLCLKNLITYNKKKIIIKDMQILMDYIKSDD